MNRQGFTFLTLFTLVLMLAVYYVTLPLDNPETLTNELIVSTDSSKLDDYREALEEKHSTEIKDSESILSNGESTLEEKLKALQMISNTEKTNELESILQSNLSMCGFDGCFVEIEDEVVRIICPNQYKGKINAAEILKEAYRFIEQEKLIEVSFE